MKRTIRIGSRDSRLAVLQTELILNRIRAAYPEWNIELVTMKTTGDLILDRTLEKIGGKGLFVKELDRALREGEIDLAVHSLKDMPMEQDEELPILAYSQREDPRDTLVLPQAPHGEAVQAKLGTSSARRRVQLFRLFEGATVASVRGNVLTRLAKLDEGDYSALVLAGAGLKRLGIDNRISRYFEPEEMLPAAGQGILAVQGRKGGAEPCLDAVNDAESTSAATAERAFVRALGGGCTAPIAAYARVCGQEVKLTGLYCSEELGIYLKESLSGERGREEQLGQRLAESIRRGGGL